ncbi:hypothetical protein [Rhodovarius sp.]|uniref:hypothetical protein n=1 Tax=Rhodovarius sp. TaxID=2972673 RepID=UPI0034A36BAA
MNRLRLLASTLAQAQAFPNRPITIQISFPAGGATDGNYPPPSLTGDFWACTLVRPAWRR